MRIIVAKTLSLLAVPLLLAGGIGRTPLRIEHAGTLPAARYAGFDQQAAASPGVKALNTPHAFPEPKWVFSFDAPFDPRAAPLRIGAFTGVGITAAGVAASLPQQRRDTLDATHLFPAVTLQPVPHAVLLSGTVTRADNEEGPDGMLMEIDAATQIEATISRDGTILGAMQVNALQLQVSGLSLLPGLIMSAAQGSRSGFVSVRVAEIFQAAAGGARQGIGVGGLSARFLRTPDPVAVPAATASR
jgi:hypothetical protein